MNKRLRFLLVLAFLGLAGYLLYPTVTWYFFTSPEMEELANGSKEYIREYSRANAKDDLDELKLLTQSDDTLDGPVPEKYEFLVDDARTHYKLLEQDVPKEWTVRSLLRGFDSGSEVLVALEDSYKDDILRIKNIKSRTVQLGLDLYGGMSIVLTAHPKYETAVDETEEVEDLNFLQKTWKGISNFFLPKRPASTGIESDLDRAMEILRNRIDYLGVVEPQIRKMNGNQILVEIPGEVDPDRVNSFLQGKGTLAFYLVDSDATSRIQRYVENGGTILENGRPADNNVIPTGLVVYGYYLKDKYGLDDFQYYLALEATPGVEGDHIQSAQVYSDPNTGEPNVSFLLDSPGGEKMYQFTRDNKDRLLAIVMDEKIKSYATIKEPLRDQIRITGMEREEAEDLAMVLRTAALPVELVVESQQGVEATLGAETIRTGLYALLYGFLAVFIFMIIYYKGSGLIADIALLLNLLFIISILSALKMTLTMTSIAGLILNIGMAVDANVIIFERIKEEIRLGKSRAAAVDAGFKKAFWTVMDANITTFIAALFLSLVGKGPIQGFAVTLAVGIICSMFTALFVSRLMFDFATETLKRQKVSIGWGLYK